MRPGPHNDLTDVPGMAVGQTTRHERGWLTGCTVVLPERAATAGVSVRGGSPGTRETDLLDAGSLVDRVDAVVLSGGSAFGLATADGVMTHLAAIGRGWPMGLPWQVVPIVPAAILFDLGRGGAWSNHPTAADGEAAAVSASTRPVHQGTVGAGTGALAGGLKGGVGSASLVLGDGTTVAALVAVNAVGSAIDSATGRLSAERLGLADEFADLPQVDPALLGQFRAAREAELAVLAEALASGDAPTTGPKPGTATTIGVVATDTTLTKAGCAKLADVAHDGMARALDPAHTAYDGDTFFALATGDRPAPVGPLADVALVQGAAGCVARAIGHAMVHATSAEGMTSWRDALTGA